jgi:hypothetical protein
MFKKEYFKQAINKKIPKKDHNLTVNFRSHNRILLMANSIVDAIEQLFPNTIDSLDKEQSDLFGPKGFLIFDENKRFIFDLLENPSASQIGPRISSSIT